MTFDTPEDDLISLELAERKGILKTTLSSAQLSRLDAQR